MSTLLRAGGFATASLAFAALFAAPSMAAPAQTAPIPLQNFSIAATPASLPTAAAPVANQPIAAKPLASPAPAPAAPAPVARIAAPAPLAAAARAVVPASHPVATARPVQQAAAKAANPFASLPAVVRPVTPLRLVKSLPPIPQPVRSLHDLVANYVNYGTYDAQQDCLAKAVYFEARSESLEGQLAVADVVLNRAASGVYPSTICEVVTQPWQFSFIRRGQFPEPNRNSRAWHNAVAIAEIARKSLAKQVPPNVLWYHANYVSPSWGRRLNRVAQIGVHIFYS